MSGVQIAPHMSRKTTVKDLNGQIITLIDEADGGYIIRNRQIVNQEKWDRMVKAQKDKEEAAKAPAMQTESPNALNRNIAPSKVESLEKRIDAQDAKLDAILAALAKK